MDLSLIGREQALFEDDVNKKSVLLMQSSGVGNCINMLSILSNCNFPFVTLITMRGEFGEGNPRRVGYLQYKVYSHCPGLQQEKIKNNKKN